MTLDPLVVSFWLDCRRYDESEDGSELGNSPPSSHDHDACTAGGIASVLITDFPDPKTRRGEKTSSGSEWMCVKRKFRSSIISSGQAKSNCQTLGVGTLIPVATLCMLHCISRGVLQVASASEHVIKILVICERDSLMPTLKQATGERVAHESDSRSGKRIPLRADTLLLPL